MMMRAPATMGRKKRASTYPALITFFVVCCTLSLAGCKSGTLTNSEQACKSTGGLFADEKITCTGSVGVVRGEPSLSVIDADGDLSGNYTLDATISVEKGEAKAYAGDEEEGGKVAPDTTATHQRRRRTRRRRRGRLRQPEGPGQEG